MVEPITRHGAIRNGFNLLTHSKTDPLDTALAALADIHHYLSRRQNYLRDNDYKRKILLQGLLVQIRAAYGIARELEESMSTAHISFKPKRRSRQAERAESAV